MVKKGRIESHDFSFGVTSAIMTSLVLIIGLASNTDRISLITALLIIAIADNLSDSFGIHIYQESKGMTPKEVKKTTRNNFITRMLATFVFILFVIFLPRNLIIPFSIFFGLVVLIILSYVISRMQKINPYRSIIRHITLAVVLIALGFILKYIILKISPMY